MIEQQNNSEDKDIIAIADFVLTEGFVMIPAELTLRSSCCLLMESSQKRLINPQYLSSGS